jgi:hypothetical protein
MIKKDEGFRGFGSGSWVFLFAEISENSEFG